MSNLPQQIARDQYIADGITSVYNYNFLILQGNVVVNDIAVYVTLAGNKPNPFTDIQPIGTAYTVQGAGTTTGGTITFQPGYIPPASAVVTLLRDMSVSIDTQFSNAQNFNGSNLDLAFERLVLIMQEFETGLMYSTLTYIVNSLLLNPGGQNILPQLPNNYIWVGQNGSVIAVQAEQNPNISLLRSQLASQADGGGDGAGLIGFYNNTTNVPSVLNDFLNNLYITVANIQTTTPTLLNLASQTEGSDGASLIGYYDTNTNVGQTLDTFLNNIPTLIEALSDSVVTGAVLDYAGAMAPTGYLLCDGSAVSRTTYASLFTAIGTIWGAGDGTTTFNVPNLARCTTIGSGGSGTGVIGNTTGNTGGEEAHTQSIAEMAAHHHTAQLYSMSVGDDTQFSAYNDGVAGAVASTSTTGSSSPFNVIQPSAVMTKIIKT